MSPGARAAFPATPRCGKSWTVSIPILQTVGAAIVHPDYKHLFEYVDLAAAQEDVMELTVTKKDNPDITHSFRVVYNAPLNKSHQDKRVTFVKYWEENSKTGKKLHFSWITDLTINDG